MADSTLPASVPAAAATATTNTTAAPSLHAYPKRWLVLALFVLYSTSNAFQWTQLVIITSILERYYEVSTIAISWTSMIYMVTYIPLIFPASWFLQKKGLRLSVLLGSLGTCAGSWIKVLATDRSQFPLLMCGQTVVAVSQIFILGIPAQLAATWFPAGQVSSACAIGVFGNQLGVALGFVVPAMVVRNRKDEDDLYLIGDDLFNMFVGVAVFTSALFIVILAAFGDRPSTPPSRGQEMLDHRRKQSMDRRRRQDADEEATKASPEHSPLDNCADKEAAAVANADDDHDDDGYLSSIRRLLSNKGYVLLLISYGLNVGVFYAISTLLNTIATRHFEDAEEDAGRIGLLIVVCGMVGSMACGFILDKTHAYKLTTFSVYAFSAIGMVLYTFAFRFGHIEVVYFAAALLGFFMTGYLPLGFEFAAEITFPESEGTSSGLLNASAQIFGILCTLTNETMLERYDDRVANCVLVGVLVIGSAVTAAISPDYRRQAAHHQLAQDHDDHKPVKVEI